MQVNWAYKKVVVNYYKTERHTKTSTRRLGECCARERLRVQCVNERKPNGYDTQKMGVWANNGLFA
jgi:hypothetical protein